MSKQQLTCSRCGGKDFFCFECAFQSGRAQANTWQPIETAPRDGSFILLAGPSGYGSTPLRVAVCRYNGEYFDPWRDHANDGWLDGGETPTHWLPLPEISI